MTILWQKPFPPRISVIAASWLTSAVALIGRISQLVLCSFCRPKALKSQGQSNFGGLVFEKWLLLTRTFLPLKDRCGAKETFSAYLSYVSKGRA